MINFPPSFCPSNSSASFYARICIFVHSSTCNLKMYMQYHIFYIWNPRFKGHDMLAPFTAGWQTADLNPLVIERSEVYLVFSIYNLAIQ